MISPHWTPPLVPINSCEPFGQYENRLYDIFRQDFITSNPVFQGMRVSVRRKREESDGKWAGFVHITSMTDKDSGERIPDFPRCEHIRFPRQVIEHYDDCPECHYSVCEKPLVWWSRRSHKDRIHILLKSERYLVVLEPHADKGYCMLVTAYYVDHDHSLRKLLRDYAKAVESGDSIQ